MASLNPALEDVRFCPHCAVEATVAFPRSPTCDACGYRALWSPEPGAPRARWASRAKPRRRTEVRAFAPAELPWDELAFWSTTQALRDFLAAA